MATKHYNTHSTSCLSVFVGLVSSHSVCAFTLHRRAFIVNVVLVVVATMASIVVVHSVARSAHAMCQCV